MRVFVSTKNELKKLMDHLMKRDELLEKLNELIDKSAIYASEPFKLDGDPDDWHREADSLLLKYINDKEISETFFKIERWYS